MKPEGAIVEVDVIHWYGTQPDHDEIRNSIEAAQEQGWYLKDSELQGVTVGTDTRQQHYTLILYYAEENKAHEY